MLYLKNGNCIVGHFAQDSISGSAILYIQNRDYFQGHWNNGVLSGQVVYYKEDAGQLIECEFEDGACKQ